MCVYCRVHYLARLISWLFAGALSKGGYLNTASSSSSFSVATTDGGAPSFLFFSTTDRKVHLGRQYLLHEYNT